jgi:hypothetical protein
VRRTTKNPLIGSLTPASARGNIICAANVDARDTTDRPNAKPFASPPAT